MHGSVLCSSAHMMCSAVQCNAVVKQCSALHCINLLCWTLSATLARSCSTHFPSPSPSVGSFRKCTARKQEPLELVLPDPSLHCLTFPLAVGQDPLWTKKYCRHSRRAKFWLMRSALTFIQDFFYPSGETRQKVKTMTYLVFPLFLHVLLFLLFQFFLLLLLFWSGLAWSGQYTALPKLQTCLFLYVFERYVSQSLWQGGLMTMTLPLGKGHGKKCRVRPFSCTVVTFLPLK